MTCFESTAAIERVRCGRPDPLDARLQAVSVDQAGRVALIHFADSGPRAEVLYENGVELSALAIADVDASVHGPEIYVGGFMRNDANKEEGGAVYQIVVESTARTDSTRNDSTRRTDATPRARVRMVHSGAAFVHSIERIEPQAPSTSAGLLVGTYDGEIHRLIPTSGSGAWNEELLHREPPSPDLEALKIKDAAFLVDRTGRARHEALVALKMGRLLLCDLDHPERTQPIHEEPGGLSRITPDDEGGAYVTGYFGRLLHFVREDDGWRVDVLDQEGADSGLRGVVRGTFPADGHVARFAVFGFHRRCRALVERLGVLDAVTIYMDTERGHTIEAADLVPGNGADELLIGGYSKQVKLLVHSRR